MVKIYLIPMGETVPLEETWLIYSCPGYSLSREFFDNVCDKIKRDLLHRPDMKETENSGDEKVRRYMISDKIIAMVSVPFEMESIDLAVLKRLLLSFVTNDESVLDFLKKDIEKSRGALRIFDHLNKIVEENTVLSGYMKGSIVNQVDDFIQQEIGKERREKDGEKEY